MTVHYGDDEHDPRKLVVGINKSVAGIGLHTLADLYLVERRGRVEPWAQIYMHSHSLEICLE